MLAERVNDWAQKWLAEGAKVRQVLVLRKQLESRFGPLPKPTFFCPCQIA